MNDALMPDGITKALWDSFDDEKKISTLRALIEEGDASGYTDITVEEIMEQTTAEMLANGEIITP